MEDYISEYFEYVTCVGCVNRVVYSQREKTVCVFIDLSVRWLLEHNEDFVKDMVELSKRCGVNVIYSDGIFESFFPFRDSYTTVYERDKKYTIYLENMSSYYKSMREYTYDGMFTDALKNAYSVLICAMQMILDEHVDGYKGTNAGLNVVYSNFRESVGYNGSEFLSSMIPYIDYIKNTDADGYIFDCEYPLADVSKEEMDKLVRDITDFCCNCIRLVFSI